MCRDKVATSLTFGSIHGSMVIHLCGKTLKGLLEFGEKVGTQCYYPHSGGDTMIIFNNHHVPSLDWVKTWSIMGSGEIIDQFPIVISLCFLPIQTSFR